MNSILPKRPVGLSNIGNICFINTAFQCLNSLKSVKVLLEVELGPEDGQDEFSFLRLVQDSLRKLEQTSTTALDMKLLKHVYGCIFKGEKFNSQQDIFELFGRFFSDLVAIPCVYDNFVVNVEMTCGGFQIYPWCLTYYLQQTDKVFDLEEKLSKAVFLEKGQDCHCGQNELHFYGQLPQCFVIAIFKLTDQNNVRRDVQLKCNNVHLINGTRYEMKCAARYDGADPSVSKKDVKVPWWNSLKAKIKNISGKAEAPLAQRPTPISNNGDQIRNNNVYFESHNRCFPPVSSQKGHYTSYVRREQSWFHASDDIVSPTNYVETDDLYVLFYERN